MKIGLIARADCTGLSVQTHEFFEQMKPTKTLLIRPTWKTSGQKFTPQMYTVDDHRWIMTMDAGAHQNALNEPCAEIEAFLEDLDVVFTCETPYNFWLFERARELKVATVLQYNWEFLAYHQEPDLPRPDLFASPTTWNFNKLPYRSKVLLPVPVNRDKLPYERRHSLNTILHTVGMPAIHDRNGTQLLQAAVELLPKTVDIRLQIYAQEYHEKISKDPRISVTVGKKKDYTKLYQEGDVFIMPRKFGGLCLPVQEAMATGMGVLMTDCSPNRDYVDPAGLLQATRKFDFMAKTKIDVCETTPRIIADSILEMWTDPGLVEHLSDWSNVYANELSWEKMRPEYLGVFEHMINLKR